MYVTRFDPAMLAEGIVDAILVVSIAGGVMSHIGAEFERIVPILRQRGG